MVDRNRRAMAVAAGWVWAGLACALRGLVQRQPPRGFRVSHTGLFPGLGRADGRILLDWLERAEAIGIDAAVDLTARPWNIGGIGLILGVFEKHRREASWLVLRCDAGWVLAGCADGSVSTASVALLDALERIGKRAPA